MADDPSEIHVLPDEGDRGFQMGRRLRRTALEAGMGDADALRLETLHEVALKPRRRALDPEAPDFLHPGRTALILLLDAGAHDPVLLSAALLVDTEAPELEPAAADVEELAPAGTLELRDDLPRPDDPDLAERLVTGSHRLALLALAERLDHLRHAHLWEEGPRRRGAHEQARTVYMPVSERTDPTLARRYRWWCGMFARRWL